MYGREDLLLLKKIDSTSYRLMPFEICSSVFYSHLRLNTDNMEMIVCSLSGIIAGPMRNGEARTRGLKRNMKTQLPRYKLRFGRADVFVVGSF